MAYVYRHIRLDTNQPFYIGISSDATYTRIDDAYDRNYLWKNIISVTSYKAEIMLDDLSWEEACAREKELISLYGRIVNGTGSLANLNGGGQGAGGVVFTEEIRRKMSECRRGKKLSNEHKLAISKGATGIKKKWSVEERKKKSERMRGKGMPSNAAKAAREYIRSVSKRVIDVKSGKIYDSISEAGRECNCMNNLWYKLTGRRKNNTSLRLYSEDIV